MARPRGRRCTSGGHGYSRSPLEARRDSTIQCQCGPAEPPDTDTVLRSQSCPGCPLAEATAERRIEEGPKLVLSDVFLTCDVGPVAVAHDVAAVRVRMIRPQHASHRALFASAAASRLKPNSSCSARYSSCEVRQVWSRLRYSAPRAPARASWAARDGFAPGASCHGLGRQADSKGCQARLCRTSSESRSRCQSDGHGRALSATLESWSLSTVEKWLL